PFTLAAMARMLETHLMGRTPHADRRISAGAAMPSVARHEPLPAASAPQVSPPDAATPASSAPAPKPASPAPATKAEEEVPVLDPTTTGQLLGMVKGGGGAAVARIYRLYLENGPPALAEIDAAIAAGDAPRVARAAHALKSMSLSLGAVRVAGFAGELEKAGRQDQARLYPGLRELTASHLDEAYAAIARLQAENEFTTEDAASAA
ncbi:MAG: Hpt domain-containing protein, partial [Methylobacterium sp.]|nr:Hpt domain-containing protein [Methylobacterium sp.]